METEGEKFNTVYGRNLFAEIKNFVHRPYLVVTMEDLWEKFKDKFDDTMAGVYFVKTLEHDELVKHADKLPAFKAVVGVGGGQAMDVAKFFSWINQKPLFQFPTSMATNAVFGHRAGIRFGSKVRYIGFVVPQAVYVDIDVIQSAPKHLNRSGVCDIFCYHTALFDWKLAETRGKLEPYWPYDERLANQSRTTLNSVIDAVDEIRDVTEDGIRVLMEADRWGGAAFHNAGWNPRHIEGVDHFLFYTLEYLTGKKFIHGQPVCLGIYIGSALQENEPMKMLDLIHRVGVDIRPEAMGLDWDTVAEGLKKMAWYVKEAGLWYTIASDRPVTDSFIDNVKQEIIRKYA